MQNKSIAVTELGFKDFQETWNFQEQLFQQIIDTKGQ